MHSHRHLEISEFSDDKPQDNDMVNCKIVTNGDVVSFFYGTLKYFCGK